MNKIFVLELIPMLALFSFKHLFLHHSFGTLAEWFLLILLFILIMEGYAAVLIFCINKALILQLVNSFQSCENLTNSICEDFGYSQSC